MNLMIYSFYTRDKLFVVSDIRQVFHSGYRNFVAF